MSARIDRSITAVFARFRLVLCCVLLLAASLPLSAQSTFERVAATPEPVTLYAAPHDVHTQVAARAATFEKDATRSASFAVTYVGFPNAARAAFQRAIDIWSTLITTPVTINVQANWVSQGPNLLGSAGPNFLWSNGVFIFPDALADLINGGDLGGGGFDIIANFNSDAAWYLGTDGNTPAGLFDLVTVVLHELGHGLGFTGGFFVNGGLGMPIFSLPVIYDRFAGDAAGISLLSPSVYPSNSVALANVLQSGNVFFYGPNAIAANGGVRAELYAPSQWAQGSSYSHLDEAVFPPGSPSSLMTPMLNFAEAIHDPGPVGLCLLADLGWPVAQNCQGPPEPCVNSSTKVCLQNGRFAVDVEWRGAQPPLDTPRPAIVSNLRTDDSGIFYFNNPNNLEMLIKVIDACSSASNRYWVFFAATTNVEFTVTVTDTMNGQVRQYFNPLGNPADAVTDTGAFATCP